MAVPNKRVFYRRAIKVGNSSGVLLPKAFLGHYVKVAVISPPKNIKKDVTSILDSFLEEIIGVYLISETEDQIEILAISTNINKHLEKRNYFVDVVPLNVLKKSLKEKQETREKIKSAKPIINKMLLFELKKLI
ncbi:hypothetical protein J4205_02975 [Candidatus Pacearchaeota archaeon]|nr:hypothetical protein [Candidatus Pacearchaeota archaeon]